MPTSKPVKIDEVEGLASALPEAGGRVVATVIRCRACGRALVVPWNRTDDEAAGQQGWQMVTLGPHLRNQWLCPQHVAMIVDGIEAVARGAQETRA